MTTPTHAGTPKECDCECHYPPGTGIAYCELCKGNHPAGGQPTDLLSELEKEVRDAFSMSPGDGPHWYGVEGKAISLLRSAYELGRKARGQEESSVSPAKWEENCEATIESKDTEKDIFAPVDAILLKAQMHAFDVGQANPHNDNCTMQSFRTELRGEIKKLIVSSKAETLQRVIEAVKNVDLGTKYDSVYEDEVKQEVRGKILTSLSSIQE